MTCVALTPCDDASPFRWIAQDGSPWSRLVSFGPSGFAAYARLRFVPDPAYEGQQEADADAVNDEAEQLRMVFDVLAEHTRTPRDCYFCLWEGTGDIVRPDSPVPDEDEDAAAYPELRAQPARVPKHAEPPRLPGPLVSVPHRSYYLFHGALSEAGAWSFPEGWPDQPRLDITHIAFAWPADHAWCVANDVDPHWAGIGADAAVIDRLVADPRLDVVPADPTAEQPVYLW
ncbi:hypothetical protein SAMN02982918_0460 [Saccharomonospora viridis]|nr:hypothetical protein SAMN02982918_0460 [Saccharomonospora viridis]